MIAPTGHASSQRAWPTQRSPLITVAVPPTTPSTSPSGQAATQAPQPMHSRGSMYGNCAIGRSMPRAAASALRSRSLWWRRRKETANGNDDRDHDQRRHAPERTPLPSS